MLEERMLTEISVLQMKVARQEAVKQMCCICLSISQALSQTGWMPAG